MTGKSSACVLFALLAWTSLAGVSLAEVRINEIGASSSDRLITRDPQGMARLGGGIQWWEQEFDDASWRPGQTPIGFGYGDIATDVRSQLGGRTPTLYLRHEFEVSAAEASSGATLSLRADFDDGFVAYLNGIEVARANAGAPFAHLHADQVAYQSHRADGRGISFRLGAASQFLQEGANVLAIEVHNVSATSSNLKMDATLSTSQANFVSSGAECTWFPGLVPPSGGVFDPAQLLGNPEFVDWVELYNGGDAAVDLSGWGLSDSSSNPLKWTFPSGITISPGGYLLVYADGRVELNRPGTSLHCNFKLAAEGEVLTLTNAQGEVQSGFIDGYPPQYPTHSYGWSADKGDYAYLGLPTPGSANAGPDFPDRVDAPDFEPKGGFFDAAVRVTLTSSTPDATIRYTLDGSEPTETHGTVYTRSIALSAVNNKTGRVVRARAFKDGEIPSKSKSHTYLIEQAREIRSIPAMVFTGDAEEVFYKPHGVMAIEGGSYSNSQWQPGDIDSYNIPMNRGIQYERPVHLEFYHADGTPGFREDAGLRLSSSSYSRPRLRLDRPNDSPWQSDPTQKPSFNLYFRGDYGTPVLDYPWLGEDYRATKFKRLRLRAGKNDIRNPWIRDELARRLYSEMGQESSVGITISLYINGSFKGFFNMTERLREDFMQVHHDSSEEWDVRQVGDYAEGDVRAWTRMMGLLNRDLTSLRNWQQAEAYLDPVNMADYFLLNIYCATWDWPQNNWVGARERSETGKYRLYVWDAEGAFGIYGRSVAHNTILEDLLGKSNDLSNLFKRLHSSPEWRLLFADRIQKHMFNGGALDDRGANPFIRREGVGLRAEFSRILNFVHREQVNMGFLTTWTSESSGRRRYLLGPSRQDFAAHGLWPATTTPVYNQHGGDVNPGFLVVLRAQAGRQIYYTLDGSDPRVPGGEVNPLAERYGGAFPLDRARVMVRARAYDAARDEWSALNEAEFRVGLAEPTPESLVISELMYHPADASVSEVAAGFGDQDDFEFVELRNISEMELDLAEVMLGDGISFSFAGGAVTTLLPGERVLVVRDLAAFRQRYGNDLDDRIAGEFSGSLSNGGDRLTLSLARSPVVPLHEVTYLDAAPWPACADGPGHSLVLLDADSSPDHEDPASWICSPQFGGNLGGEGIRFDYARWADFVFDADRLADESVSGPRQDPDGDGLDNFGEYVYGLDPLVYDPLDRRPTLERSTVGEQEFLTFAFRRSRFELPLNYILQASEDLVSWSAIPSEMIEAAAPVANEDGSVRESWRFLEPAGHLSRRFVRLVVEEEER